MRFSTLLALPFVVTGALAQGIARDFNIEGCVGVTAVLNPALGLGASLLTGLFTTESACANACRQRGSQYAYFLGGQVLSTVTSCACSNTAPQVSALVTAVATLDAALTGGICGTASFEAIRVTSDFRLRACAFADAFTSTSLGPTTNNIGTAANCLASCTGFAYAIVNLANNGACTCASRTSIVNAARVGACSKTGANNAIYLNLLAPIASRDARKRDIAVRGQVPLGLCPTGLQACLLGDNASSTATDSFECIDTRSELESCGGCVYGLADSLTGSSSAGVDCSALPGVALGGSTCTLGKCEIFACKKGHTLVEGRCQPRK